MQYYLPFLFDLSKYSMPLCFFAHPNEIQLDLTNLTSSRWKHINLMYKVEKRMQLKTSGTWNDIWWPVTTQPGQWQSAELARECSFPPPGPSSTSLSGEKLAARIQLSQPGHTCLALLNKFLFLCLDKFYREHSENYHEQGQWDQSGKCKLNWGQGTWRNSCSRSDQDQDN